MAFINQAVTVLQTLVIALGAGLAVWGVVNLMEGYGNDNPGARVLGELSYQDIAKLFGKTESWARVTFHRAKLKIIEQVKEESYE